MHEPNYEDYSLSQLYECLAQINRKKYPERLQLLETEIELRTEMGEAAVDPLINQLTAPDVPFSVGFRALLCFSWRAFLMGIFIALVTTGIDKINALLHLLPPIPLIIIKCIVALGLTALLGSLIMMQVFSIHYPGYRIRVINITDSDRSATHRSMA